MSRRVLGLPSPLSGVSWLPGYAGLQGGSLRRPVDGMGCEVAVGRGVRWQWVGVKGGSSKDPE